MECTTQARNIGFLWVEKNRINVDPPYQRESGVWSIEKKQLFIDSILNGFDVPKAYFHDVTAQKGPFSFAVIDGKQRLGAIWEFMNSGYPLADDFKFTGNSSFFKDGEAPQGGTKYSSFNERQVEYFRSQTIDVVFVKDAEEDDIEELFSRLNNGEPLNAAEKRNAMGGEMIQLVREVAKNPFFEKRLGFPNRRLSYHEVAAKIIRLELGEMDGGDVFCDLKKKFLDELVKANKSLPKAKKEGLNTRISKHLADLSKVFSDSDPLLGKQSYPQLYYGWSKTMFKEYALPGFHRKIKSFLEDFHTQRIANLQSPEDERDPTLVEFGRLMQQGTNDLRSMQARSRILTRYLLVAFPDIQLKDTSRSFTDEERFAIWLRSGKRCAKCEVDLAHIGDMEADHVDAWSRGGSTLLSNAQALCTGCNREKGAR